VIPLAGQEATLGRDQILLVLYNSVSNLSRLGRIDFGDYLAWHHNPLAHPFPFYFFLFL